jgi:hypothetical protein
MKAYVKWLLPMAADASPDLMMSIRDPLKNHPTIKE